MYMPLLLVLELLFKRKRAKSMELWIAWKRLCDIESVGQMSNMRSKAV